MAGIGRFNRPGALYNGGHVVYYGSAYSYCKHPQAYYLLVVHYFYNSCCAPVATTSTAAAPAPDTVTQIRALLAGLTKEQKESLLGEGF